MRRLRKIQQNLDAQRLTDGTIDSGLVAKRSLDPIYDLIWFGVRGRPGRPSFACVRIPQ